MLLLPQIWKLAALENAALGWLTKQDYVETMTVIHRVLVDDGELEGILEAEVAALQDENIDEVVKFGLTVGTLENRIRFLRRALVERDWHNDSRGEDAIDIPRFYDSVFEIVGACLEFPSMRVSQCLTNCFSHCDRCLVSNH